MIPYASPNETRIVSDRVVSISIDQFTTLPSLDRIALEAGLVRQLAALALVALLAVAAACGSGEQAEPTPAAGTATQESAAQEDDLPRGGTLRVGLVDWPRHELEYASPDGKAQYAFDPQADYGLPTFELFRCCLLRTLFSYNGKPTAEGGAELRPDLASGPPEVSADGLTWTLRLKPGLRYAPPYEDTEIVAADVIRAVERTLRPAHPSYAEATGIALLGIYASYYTPLIEGSEAFAAGEADTVSGLEAPDDQTLLVHLTEPSGDLGHRFSLPATAPIPPGAADGHDDGYGPFLVASGPYMLEAYEPGRAITLVRNPSWTPATDGLRAAYADRIELTVAVDAETAFSDIDAGRSDLVFDWSAPPAVVERYRADPELQERLILIPQDTHFYAAMNVAQPPFDDLHVRRAANLVVDRPARSSSASDRAARASRRTRLPTRSKPISCSTTTPSRPRATVATSKRHEPRWRPPTTTPTGTASATGPRARTSGRSRSPSHPSSFRQARSTCCRRILPGSGSSSRYESAPPNDVFPALATQDERHAIVLNYIWAKDFPNGSGWFPATLGAADPTANPSLLGQSPEQLGEWGYPVTTAPGLDGEIAECVRLAGGAQTQCWAALDQLVMEEVVPWIVYAAQNQARTVSARVASISIDQYTTLPSLDRIALEDGS